MKNIFFPLTLIGIHSTGILNMAQAQDGVCGTPQDKIYTSARVISSTTTTSSTIITVNVVFHIMNNVVPESSTTDMINLLNNSFKPHNIQFAKLCVNHISSSNTDPYDLPYAINIHIFDFFVVPYAGGIGSNVIYFSGSAGSTSTLPHEMGHCLYLFHTHNERGCLELIDESNCTTCGDEICDTPADPKLYSGSKGDLVDDNCNYIGTATQNGVPYKPDTHNIMSYALSECRNHFTTQQGKRMYNALLSLDVLIPTTKAPEIQGPSTICSNDPVYFSFKVFPTSTLVWSSSNISGLKIDRLTGQAIRQNNFIGQVTVTATGSGCGSASLTKSVTIGTGTIDPLLSQLSVVCPNDPYDYSLLATIDPASFPTNASYTYKWYIGSSVGVNFVLEATTTSNVAGVPGGKVDNQYHTLRVDLVNACGTVSTALAEGRFKASCSSGGSVALTAYPNPTSSSITIQLTDSLSTNTSTSFLEQKYDLLILDRYSKKIMSIQSSNKVINLSTENIPSDIYYLIVNYKDAVLSKQIVINR